MYSSYFYFIYTILFSYPYQSKFGLSFFVSCDPVSSYRFALCFAVAKLISSSPMFLVLLFSFHFFIFISLFFLPTADYYEVKWRKRKLWFIKTIYT